MMQFFRKNTRSIMLVIVVVFVVSCFAMYGTSNPRGSAGGRDYAVAKVDGKKIMYSRLEQDVAQMLQSMGGMQPNVTSEDMPAIRVNVLDQIAILAEIEKEIKARGIKIRPESVDEAYDSIAASFPTREIFMQQMQQAGVDEKKLKENLTRQLRQNALFEEIVAEVSIDKAEVRSYYDTMSAVNAPMLMKQEGFTMVMAHFANLESATKAYDDINGGKKWDDVMNGAKSGDVLEFIPYDAPVFIPTAQLTEQASFLRTQALNAVSKPIEIDAGDYMLAIKRTEQKAGTASFDEISGDIERMLRGQKGQALQSKFIQDMKNRSVIEILDNELFKVSEPTDEPETEATDSGEQAASGDQ